MPIINSLFSLLLFINITYAVFLFSDQSSVRSIPRVKRPVISTNTMMYYVYDNLYDGQCTLRWRYYDVLD